MRVGLIGAGRQGKRRVDALRQTGGHELVHVADTNKEAAISIAKSFNCAVSCDWTDVVNNKSIDIVLVCTPPDTHVPICTEAFNNSKHVLCEKPLARNGEDALKIVEIAEANKKKLKCGFNLRFHPGIKQARKWFDEGIIGDLNFMRCRYGIMGIPDIKKDWRGDAGISGGGEIIDRGVHVVDFFHWFMGDFSEVTGFAASRYWGPESVEDNGFALLRTNKQQIASMHVSSTQWKNIFSLELFGSAGYIVVEGLGYVYGTERAILGKKQSVPGPNHEEVIEYLGPDQSWLEEWKEFTQAIEQNREPLGNGFDSWQALRLVGAIYKSNATGRVIKLQ